MKIFFPIIAALILLCLGSCGYANYCKKPSEHNEDEEVDRSEEVYSLSKPDRPYLTPHYQGFVTKLSPKCHEIDMRLSWFDKKWRKLANFRSNSTISALVTDLPFVINVTHLWASAASKCHHHNSVTNNIVASKIIVKMSIFRVIYHTFLAKSSFFYTKLTFFLRF